jgi:protein HOOK3
LNETVDQLDALRKEHADLEVQFDTQKRELTIAKSDRPCPNYILCTSLTRDPLVNLINKDQVEILASLRESVNEDKAFLEVETDRLKKQIKELGEKNRMQLEQVNALLLEKVNLQSDGIGQRERMLQRERDIGFVLASLVRACR